MSIKTKRIFFGHQSVGANIIEGIRELTESSLRIVESRNVSGNHQPGFFHAAIGTNKDPSSKIEDFVTLTKNGIGGNVDIACFKFCYIDISRETNVPKLFAQYQNTMSELISLYPQTTFIHITVPIRTVEPRLRLAVKRILGKKSIAIEDNRSRQLFNENILDAFGGKHPVLDLAGIESTYPSGRRCSQSLEGKRIYSLVSDYTDDGGHLNSQGRQKIGQEFIDFLSRID